MGIYLMPWDIIQYHLIFLLKLFHLSHWELFQLAPVSLWHTPINVGLFLSFSFLSTSLRFGTVRASGLITHTAFHSPQIRYFSKDFWFLLLENGFRNQDLGARCACCYWGVVSSRFSQLTQKEIHVSIQTHTHVYINTQLSILLCVIMRVYIVKREFFLMSPTRTHYQMDHSDLPLLICKFPLQQWAMILSFLKASLVLIHGCTSSIKYSAWHV